MVIFFSSSQRQTLSDTDYCSTRFGYLRRMSFSTILFHQKVFATGFINGIILHKQTYFKNVLLSFVGYWPFGLIVCDIWQVSDVMMCTSSIMHMCSISLDRYIAIRRPLLVRNKSRTVVGIKIATGKLFFLTTGHHRLYI